MEFQYHRIIDHHGIITSIIRYVWDSLGLKMYFHATYIERHVGGVAALSQALQGVQSFQDKLCPWLCDGILLCVPIDTCSCMQIVGSWRVFEVGFCHLVVVLQ